MPLTAMTGDNELVVSIDCDEDEWQALSDTPLRCPDESCAAPMHQRSPVERIRHFAHNPNAARFCALAASESPEHVAMKVAIYRAGQALIRERWAEREDVMVRLEYSGPSGWRADVFAALGERQVAFEVQRSPQKPQVTRERTAAHRGDDVRTLWVVDDPAQWSRLAPYAPTVRLSDAMPENVLASCSQWWIVEGWFDRLEVPLADGSTDVDVIEESTDLETMMAALLTGQLTWSSTSMALMRADDAARFNAEAQAEELRQKLADAGAKVARLERDLSEARRRARFADSRTPSPDNLRNMRLRIEGLEMALRVLGVDPDSVPEPFK